MQTSTGNITSTTIEISEFLGKSHTSIEPLRRKFLVGIIEFTHLLIVAFCFLFCFKLIITPTDQKFTLSEFLSTSIRIQDILIFLALLTIWHFIFSSFGLYYSRRLSTWLKEISDVLKATSAGTFIALLLFTLLNLEVANHLLLSAFWASTSLVLILFRLSLRYFFHNLRAHGRNLRNIVVVGVNERSLKLIKNISNNPYLGFNILGFVESDPSRFEDAHEAGYKMLCELTKLRDFINQNVVDEVLICLPFRSHYDNISETIRLCEDQGITVRILSDFFQLQLSHSKFDIIAGQPVITFSSTPMKEPALIVKRLIDILMSSILIFLLSPVFLITVLMITFFSPGPIFFTQNRLGFNKRKFKIFKFRTMIINAEKHQENLKTLNEAKGPVFKIKEDPRITPVGKFLRRTSIDELPQLFNVLKGDMSLVGPRPLPVRDYEGFTEDWHRRRFSVRPGITCFWQVSGRSNISFEKWMELDMQYIDNWSLLLDLKILLKTIPAVVRGTGAA